MFSKPFQIVSLWDIMEQFIVSDFLQPFLKLGGFETAILIGLENGAKDKIGDVNELERFKEVLDAMRVECEKIELDVAADHIRLVQWGIGTTPHPTYSSLISQVRSVRIRIILELKKHKYLWVSDSLAQYIERSELFGTEVSQAFPSACADIKEAGNCLAVGCHTAAVFHLMRAVEWGLRAFCSDVGLDEVCINKEKHKYIPVAYSDWERILSQLPKKVDEKVEKIQRGTEKQSAQEFYYPLLQEFTAFKEAWRNHVMHTRREYNQEDVVSILTHVKSFLVRLSSRISES